MIARRAPVNVTPLASSMRVISQRERRTKVVELSSFQP